MGFSCERFTNRQKSTSLYVFFFKILKLSLAVKRLVVEINFGEFRTSEVSLVNILKSLKTYFFSFLKYFFQYSPEIKGLKQIIQEMRLVLRFGLLPEIGCLREQM